jgi:8-oxo-dGTP diphosphatase
MGKNNKKIKAGDRLVRASGVVPYALSVDGIRVLLIHRPRYDDWSFPKGKVDDGETDERCAVREMEEETGVLAELGAELPTALYDDHKGRPKEVRYWLMEVPFEATSSFVPNDEVDRIAWVDVADARQRLTYPLDRGLLHEALLLLGHDHEADAGEATPATLAATFEGASR